MIGIIMMTYGFSKQTELTIFSFAFIPIYINI